MCQFGGTLQLQRQHGLAGRPSTLATHGLISDTDDLWRSRHSTYVVAKAKRERISHPGEARQLKLNRGSRLTDRLGERSPEDTLKNRGVGARNIPDGAVAAESSSNHIARRSHPTTSTMVNVISFLCENQRVQVVACSVL